MSGIFICYRRDDTGGYAGRLYDRLARQFGKGQIFMDIDAIPIGSDFVQVIDQRIRGCDVVVALIGKNWLKLADLTGSRRVYDPVDFVRLEIEVALTRNIALIPVLVGGARMPNPQDLPGNIVRLAYLNAFEIYDRMFEESTAGLISTLRPLVKTPYSERWRTVESALLDILRPLRSFGFSHRKRRLAVALAAIALVLFLFSFIAPRLSDRSPPTRSAQPPAGANVSAPPRLTPRLDAGAAEAPAMELKTPVRVSELPPVVDSARHVGAGYDRAVGPRRAKIAWQADFPSLGSFLGLAEDGTLYFGGGMSDINLESIYAIRDGKQQWAYNLAPAYRSPSGNDNVTRALFAADGRVWVEQQFDSVERNGDSRFFVFNSRGAGGLTASKQHPELAAYAKITDYGWGKGGLSGWTIHQKTFQYKDCELGELTGVYLEPTGMSPDKPWKLSVEGSCGISAVNDDGDLITVTDAGVVYCIRPQGQVRWTGKVACQPDRLVAWGGAGAVYACANVLHALRSGEQQWTFKLEAGVGSYWHDKRGTLYVLTRAPFFLLAIDDAGKLLWQLPVGNGVMPLGLDRIGRMYVRSQSTIMCLSD